MSSAAAGTGSPAHAEGGVIPPATCSSVSLLSPAGVPAFGDAAAPPSPPGDDIDHNSSVIVGGSSLAGGGGDVGGAGSGANSPPGPGAGGGGGGEGAEGAGDGDWGSKMGLQLSALFVQRALMVFRRERAAMVRPRWVVSPSLTRLALSQLELTLNLRATTWWYEDGVLRL